MPLTIKTMEEVGAKNANAELIEDSETLLRALVEVHRPADIALAISIATPDEVAKRGHEGTVIVVSKPGGSHPIYLAEMAASLLAQAMAGCRTPKQTAIIQRRFAQLFFAIEAGGGADHFTQPSTKDAKTDGPEDQGADR